MAYTLQWTRLHQDYLRRIKVSRCDTYLELCKGWFLPCLFQQKITGKLFSGFLCCVEVSPNFVPSTIAAGRSGSRDYCTGASALIATFNFTGITFKVGVLHWISPPTHFVHLSSSVSLVRINKLLNFLH